MKKALLVLLVYTLGLLFMATAPLPSRTESPAFPTVPQKMVKYDLLDKKDRELLRTLHRDPKLRADCETWLLCWNGLCVEFWRRGCSGRGYGGGGGGAF
jgi:hypothetical protein